MSRENKVIWSEGLFIKPAHFQQSDRYVESYIEKRCQSLTAYGWGFDELTLDRQLLQQGKIAVKSASGIMPDGTPFNIPEDDSAPPPLELPEGVINERVYLSLPLRSTELEVYYENSESALQRYDARSIEVNDVTNIRPSDTTLLVGGLRFALLRESDTRSQYGCIGVADVIECSKDKIVNINESYIPPSLNCSQSKNLQDMLINTQGLLQQRGAELGGRITASAAGTGGVAEVEDFLCLQVINRYTQLVGHLIGLPRLHPEDAYQHMLMLVGELATFSDSRIMGEVAGYRHDELAATYEPLDKYLRESLSTLSTKARAFPIPLKDPKYGIYRGPLNDPSIVNSSTFILTVKADVPSTDLQQMFPNQVKISAIEAIRELVMASLPGIGLKSLPYIPRELPYHDGYIAFELDRSSPVWQGLVNSAGIAIHIGGEIPGLKLQLWAIQR